MANPRQRRKSRSSASTKPSLNAKKSMKKKLARSPTVKGAEVLKQGWDPKLTARQNYAQLGLVASLDVRPNTGGVDRADPTHPDNVALAKTGSSSSSSSSLRTGDADGEGAVDGGAKTNKTRKGMARVIRDDAGNIVDVIEAENEVAESSATPWGKPMRDIEADDEEIETYMPPQKPTLQRGEKPNPVIQQLDSLAASAAPVERHTSNLEAEWLINLVARHNDDFHAMAHDRTLNPWQKTPGEIKRAIKKAGGLDTLRP
ncbi:hypothetical protein BCV70DRAFT_9255 [Testicularia cyperi]|uniref:Nucleolar protein 16 n=1 Tax=Testicularia cyperi TaxID=1882483 RepID=A0A317XYH5_9BASI|nr:hypothetical protein BCV70DRAFT_9255 [Testicularia cyperi]